MPLHTPTIRRLIGDRAIAAVARDAQMTNANLHALLSGRQTDPKLSTIERLAKALGVSARLLIR